MDRIRETLGGDLNAAENRKRAEDKRAWAAQQTQAYEHTGAGECCATIAPRPNLYHDPRGWAHDICAHHAPSPDGLQRIAAIRAATENLVNEILRSCPDCGDRHQAIAGARMTMMFANASIALEGRV